MPQTEQRKEWTYFGVKKDVFVHLERLRRAKAKALGLDSVSWNDFFKIIIREIEK